LQKICVKYCVQLLLPTVPTDLKISRVGVAKSESCPQRLNGEPIKSTLMETDGQNNILIVPYFHRDNK